MKKLFDEDDEHYGIEKARILAFVIPVLLILLILAFMLVKSRLGGERHKEDDLQQSIMDYADENKEEQAADPFVPANSSSASSVPPASPDADEEDAGSEGSPSGQPEAEKSQDNKAGQSRPESIPSPTPYKEVMEPAKDYSKITYHKEEQLRDMMAYWADNNQKALDDLAYLDHYIAMSYSLRGTTDFYYYGDTDSKGSPDGKGIAVYADNQYYYGDWKGGVRSGSGTWIHYHIHLGENQTPTRSAGQLIDQTPARSAGQNDLYTYHQYTGSWAGDLPDGEGSEHYDYDQSLLEENTSYVANLIGSYAKGLVNGEFYLTSIYADGSSGEWNAEAKNGAWKYQSDTKDKKGNRTVYVDAHDPNNYTWMHPKNNAYIGVPCLLSKNRDKNGKLVETSANP